MKRLVHYYWNKNNKNKTIMLETQLHLFWLGAEYGLWGG